MKDNFDANSGGYRAGDNPSHHANGAAANGRSPSKPPIDFWVALDILGRRWHWLVLGACISAAGFFYVGLELIKPKFTAVAQMQRYETPGIPEALKVAPMTPETFASLIRAPELLRRVGNQANPPIPPERLTRMIKIDPEPDSEFVKISFAAREPQQAVDLLNFYAKEIVQHAREFQTNQIAKLANDYLKRQLTQMEQEIAGLQTQFRNIAAPPSLRVKLSEIQSQVTAIGTNVNSPQPGRLLLASQMERLGKAVKELDALREQYTDLHPKVIAKDEEIKEIRSKLEQASAGNTNQSIPILPDSPSILNPGPNPSSVAEMDIVRIKLTSMEDARTKLMGLQTDADSIFTDPPGMVRVFAPANMKTVQKSMLQLKIGLISIFGALLGMGVSLAVMLLVELTDNRLRNTDDVRRVTKLPILTTLGNLDRMSQADRAKWAFRSWTMLQGRLSPTANHGLVCGLTSSTPGEGRSTWIHMLAEAASLTGFRVLTISTRPTTSVGNGDGEPEQLADLDPETEARSEDETAMAAQMHEDGSMADGSESRHARSDTALANSVLSAPSQVTEKFNDPNNSQPMVHIPLPGWVWNLERRKQWRDALTQWRSIDNLVILVELPPACVAEAVLLGCNLPNLVWLTESGKADAAETRTQLATLRHARCNLVGAVLNREPCIPFRNRFPRWLDSFATIFLLSAIALNAQEAPPSGSATESETKSPVLTVAAVAPAAPAAAAPAASTRTNVGFSITDPSQRAAWQERLTLGPGDVLNFGLYGQPDLVRTEVAVTPDGTVTYLQAADIPVTGLTIDELREKLDKELSQYYRGAKTIITPVTFRSKRYYMLGKIMTKGVYVLDRPITVLEAIARAHGLENGLVDRNVIDLADFSRSFLMRGGKRFPLNFEKLFQEGDLAQNIAIEPGDYLYFPSTSVKEVYVVGEIRLPGAASWNPNMTVLSAIAARGGYTDRAFKMRVLVVRGSINNPEKLVIDTHATLDGFATDFRLQPKDIVYVNSRPFIRVEELADMAVTAFIQSLITTWVGVEVVKPIVP